MNSPEKIAQAYLRLNGFFTIPHFTILKNQGGHIDLLAVRLSGSLEKVGVEEYKKTLTIDEELLSKLNINKNNTIGLIIEVKGSKRKLARVDDEDFEYAKGFFGNIDYIRKVGFENRKRIEIVEQGDHIIIPLRHCIKFIKSRFSELKEIKQHLRRSGMLSKEGSWSLSEDFLSDLIFLEKLNHIDD